MTQRLAALALLLCLPAFAGERRFALVIGNADGGAGTRRLHYAERDARRIHAILLRLGGVRADDAALVLDGGSGDVLARLDELSAKALLARARGDSTLLFVFYSGHAKDGDLRLGSTRLPLPDLRDRLQRAPMDVRIGLIDSCQSGAITRAKGARPAPAFDVSAALPSDARPHGLVLIASSSADEESQESDEIGASFFTHSLASGLLGGADTSGDGKVTLAEAYAYAYARTVAGTAETRAGSQHPVYLYDLGGAGDVVLTDLSPWRGGLVFPAGGEGLYVVLDGGRRAVAEVAKAAGEERRLALAPGNYLIKKREADHLLVGDVSVAEGPVEVTDSHLSRSPLEADPQKGASGPRWSLLGTVGGQFFFDAAARNGLFPPAALAGAELTTRDDLGHDLSWGLDLSLGGGRATVTLPGAQPFQERFVVLGAGASLLREFPLSESLTVSAGVRVAGLYLARSFDAGQGLPSQSFFTLTPGLTSALSVRLSERLEAVVRGRLNYLFYNVDKSKSLGFCEASVGIDYGL